MEPRVAEYENTWGVCFAGKCETHCPDATVGNTNLNFVEGPTDNYSQPETSMFTQHRGV